jgi:hypothetical protein
MTYITIAGQRQRPKYFMKSLSRESLPPAEEPPPSSCKPRSSRIFAIDTPRPAGVLMSHAIFDFDRSSLKDWATSGKTDPVRHPA